jgi:hypothetical protein
MACRGPWYVTCSSTVVKSAATAFSGKSDNCSTRSSRLPDVKPRCGAPQARGRSYKSAQPSICRSPSSSRRQPGMAHHTSARATPRILRNDVLAHAKVFLTCRPESVLFQWHWAPLTVTLPLHSLGYRNAWALGPTELFSWPAQGPWAGSFAVPVSPVRQSVESRVTVGRATGTGDDKPRFGFTSCGRKVGSPKITARFESVCSCVPDMDFVGPRSISRQR